MHADDSQAGTFRDEPALVARRLSTLLGEQIGLYESLDELGAKQADLIEQGSGAELLSLIQQRERVVGEITRLNAELSPLAGSWETLRDRLPEDDAKSIAERVERVGLLVERIRVRDERDTERLNRARQRVSDELRTLSSRRTAAAAYGAQPGADTPRFQDREG
ncbi:MAG: flagellar export chaperone FlgN [Planctomycetota bacterium]